MRDLTNLTPSASQRLEGLLEHYTLEYGPREPIVEDMKLPPLVPLFRQLVRLSGRPPSQRAFCEAVAAALGLALSPGLFGRAGRAWISLVVQLHAYVVLRERYGLVAWDDDLDMRYGVDLVVVGDDGVAVGLALRAPTPRSGRLTLRKQVRYQALPLVVRELPVEAHAYMAGRFWLYRPSALIDLVEEARACYWRGRAAVLWGMAAGAYATGERRPRASRQDFLDGFRAAVACLQGRTE